ncbi:MAG: aldo/keto reductase [Clostridiales bacterium]|nr:aldo/keto reductase [Clostridiales bacterium]
MKKVDFGKTGYKVSPIVFAGIVSMSEQQADSDRYVAQAIDFGVNYFDVAPSYLDAEVILGNSLKPYRKDVYLACKSTERRAQDAQKEFQASLKRLHTDYFDVYQVHSLSTPEDVEVAFGPGGIMEMILKYHKEGVIRKVGFSAHSERAALEALKLYDFDSVMFPMNWQLNMEQGIGNALMREKQKKGFALLAIKAIIERAWLSQEEREASPWPKGWCKPFDADDTAARMAGMRFAFHMGADVLIPPGNWECQSSMQDLYEQVAARPYGPEDEQLLTQRLAAASAHPFFKKDEGGWTAA